MLVPLCCATSFEAASLFGVAMTPVSSIMRVEALEGSVRTIERLEPSIQVFALGSESRNLSVLEVGLLRHQGGLLCHKSRGRLLLTMCSNNHGSIL